MKTRMQKVKKEYGLELAVGLLVMTAVVTYAYIGSLVLNS
jgi:uncharacterized membrane protein (DUF485 family)